MKPLHMRKALPADAEALFALQTDNCSLASYSLELCTDLEALRSQIQQAKPYEATYLIQDDKGSVVASCTFYDVIYRNRFGFVQLHFAHPEDMEECLARFLQLAFIDLGFVKINVYLTEQSPALFDLLASQGFRLEVRLREHLLAGGEFWDVYHLGMLRTEYPCQNLVASAAPAVPSRKKSEDDLLKPNVAPDRYLLQGEKVALTMIDRGDLDQLYAHMRTSNAGQYSTISAVGPSGEHSIQWMAEKKNDYFAMSDRISFGIRKRDQGDVIGDISAVFIDLLNANLMLGISIYQTGERSRGFGSEAITMLTDFCFLELNMHRVYLGCFSFNGRAAALYERLGFVREGVNRSFVYRNGNYYDEIAFGVTRTEWFQLRGYLA